VKMQGEHLMEVAKKYPDSFGEDFRLLPGSGSLMMSF
jgi:hypothetical protein